MDAQDQTQMVTNPLQTVKYEAAEEHGCDFEDQLTVSQLLLSQKDPIDCPPKRVSDNPSRSGSDKSGRERADFFSDFCNDNFEEAQTRVMVRAAEIQARLAPEFPSFWKLMMRSHVTREFWLGLPSEFCKSYLPRLDAEVVLEDESGEQYITKYLVSKTRLSGGWKGFSIAQKLLKGDAVVFHLVSPIKFKVYIVRAKDFEVADGLSLPSSDACAKETGFEQNSETCKKGEEKRPRLEVDGEFHLDRNIIHSDTTEVSKTSGPIPDIMNFNIVANALTIDSLSANVRTKYYDLFRTQKSYLHKGLFNSNMAAVIISETVNIADSIRASEISTSPNDLARWDKTLEAFGLLGMDVQFLRDRLSRLVNLLSESREVSERYEKTSIERGSVQREMKSLELKLLGLRQDRRRLDDEIQDLKEEAQKMELLFQKEATAQW